MTKLTLITAGILVPACFFFYAMGQTKPKPPISAATMERGKKVYAKECLPCHQANGKGVQRMNPPLVKTKYVLGDKKTLITVIVKGLNEPVEINGDTYENIMPSHPNLTDQEIADVLTYVRNSFGNKASAISAVDVKNVKAKIK